MLRYICHHIGTKQRPGYEVPCLQQKGHNVGQFISLERINYMRIQKKINMALKAT
jgi:hypothetical protein